MSNLLSKYKCIRCRGESEAHFDLDDESSAMQELFDDKTCDQGDNGTCYNLRSWKRRASGSTARSTDIDPESSDSDDESVTQRSS